MLAVDVMNYRGLAAWEEYIRGVGGEGLVYAKDNGQRVFRLLELKASGATIIIDREGREVYQDTIGTPYDILMLNVENAL